MPMRDPDNDVLFSSLAVSKSLLGLFHDNLQTHRVLTEKHHSDNIRPSVLVRDSPNEIQERPQPPTGMKGGLWWKPAAAAVLFVGVALYTDYIRRQRLAEGFLNVADMMRNLREASGALGQGKSYDQWIGWMYQNPATATKALNDFKARVFAPECEFRPDWSTVLPKGLNRPMAPPGKQYANIAYKTYLDCLANGSYVCVQKLDDFKKRFMKPNCNFKRVTKSAEYNRNYTPVFE